MNKKSMTCERCGAPHAVFIGHSEYDLLVQNVIVLPVLPFGCSFLCTDCIQDWSTDGEKDEEVLENVFTLLESPLIEV